MNARYLTLLRNAFLIITIYLVVTFTGIFKKTSSNVYESPSENLESPEAREEAALENVWIESESDEHLLDIRPNDNTICPDYSKYANHPHSPLSNGPLKLPFQRPAKKCRTFHSGVIEEVIDSFNEKLLDEDLARLFENCFPNTLDTTIKWHVAGSGEATKLTASYKPPQTFVVTGDINAEWLRDSAFQLSPYFPYILLDDRLRELVLGAITTQAEFVSVFPYCNAFNPPRDYLGPRSLANIMSDSVFPPVNPAIVFECKWELDSIASFLALITNYYKFSEGDTSFVTVKWRKAIDNVFKTLKEQSMPTFDATGRVLHNGYRFQRWTNLGTETLNLGGEGNPVNRNASLIRSAFRPSDDATIFQYFIPANAMIAVQLRRLSVLLKNIGDEALSIKALEYSDTIANGIWTHGIYTHPTFGTVFAYEVDGFGSILAMDDANVPSLLSLPDLGFIDRDDPIYQNTRRMILSKEGNPYYLRGTSFKGIGGPHVGIENAWPISLLVAIRTSDDDEEILENLDLVKKSTAGLGLMHESVAVDDNSSFTRAWFAWANSEFAKTILDLAKRKPYLIFKKSKEETEDYVQSEVDEINQQL